MLERFPGQSSHHLLALLHRLRPHPEHEVFRSPHALLEIRDEVEHGVEVWAGADRVSVICRLNRKWALVFGHPNLVATPHNSGCGRRRIGLVSFVELSIICQLISVLIVRRLRARAVNCYTSCLLAETTTHFKGKLTPAQVAEGINATRENARRLAKDAQLLLEAERYPTAASIAALAIEESGKESILRGMVLARDDKEVAQDWRDYRAHTKKNAAWILPDLAAKGARTLEDLRPMFDQSSLHP